LATGGFLPAMLSKSQTSGENFPRSLRSKPSYLTIGKVVNCI
jgi:hypothetical protein